MIFNFAGLELTIYIAQAGLKLNIFLPLLPECWNCRHAPVWQASEQFWICRKAAKIIQIVLVHLFSPNVVFY
jgi:hypothetical protein